MIETLVWHRCPGRTAGLTPIAAALALLGATTPAQAVDASWFGGTGNWNVAGNWSPAGVPGAGDRAIVNAGVVTLPSAQSVGAFRLNNGTINGAGNLAVAGLTEFIDGQIGGFGGQIIGNGGVAISGAAGKTLGASNGTISSGLVNGGAGTWSGTGNISNWGTGRFTNTATGSFDIQTDADFSNGTFINQGALTKSVGAGGSAKTQVSALFENSGSVDVQQGTLAFTGGGSHTGSFTTGGSGWVEFAGSSSKPTHELNAGASVTGNARHVSSFGATVVNTGASYNTARTELTGSGRLEVAAGVTASSGTLGVFGGFYVGGGNLVVSGLTEYSDGQIGGFGGQIIGNGGVAISGAAGKTLGASNGTISSGLVNGGAGTWSGTGNISNWGTGRFTNTATGSFDIQTDADFSNGTFINQGALTKSVGAGGSAKTQVSALFENSGSVDVQQGTLAFTVGGSHTGSFTTGGSGWVEFAGSSSKPTHELNAGASVTGNARHVSSFGATLVNAGASYNTARTELTGSGRLDVASAVTANTATLGMAGGTYGGAGNLAVSGLTEYTDGQIGGYGGQVFANGGLTISGTAGKTLGASNGIVSSGLVNNGAGTWTGSGNISNWSNGRFTNTATGSFDIQTDADFSSGTFINQGVLIKSVGSSQASTLINAAFTNTGSVQVQRGVLEVNAAFDNQGLLDVAGGAVFEANSSFSNSGTVRGNGTVRAPIGGALVNNGRIAPGSSTGILTLDGDLTMAATGTAQFELTSFADFDRLVIGDDAFFAGTLEVANLGYTPVIGESFTIITFDERLVSSQFTSITTSGFSPAIAFNAVYNLHDVTLTVTAVPEPGTWAMWLAGLAGLCGIARRRRPAAEGVEWR